MCRKADTVLACAAATLCIVSVAAEQTSRGGLLERLAAGPLIGDGSFVMTLERRSYVKAGPWTPEAVVQYPDAVRQLHRDFLRAGADVMQTSTFYSSDDKLQYAGHLKEVKDSINCRTVNEAACDLVPGYAEKGRAYVIGEFHKQLDVFKGKRVDSLLGEFFGNVEEAEWSIEVMRQSDLPVACTMRIGPAGDLDGVTPEECAIRMAKAGAAVVGVNCFYDPFIALDIVSRMKNALDKAGLSVHLMIQPMAWHSPEIRNDQRGYSVLPEFPFAMEPRLLTRAEVARFARQAYAMGIRYIGGCCGFEPYHIRAIAEELADERGFRPPGKDKHSGFESLQKSVSEYQRPRGNRQYWEKLVPASGRKDGKLLADVPPKAVRNTMRETGPVDE